jgi:hypothetical protein
VGKTTTIPGHIDGWMIQGSDRSYPTNSVISSLEPPNADIAVYSGLFAGNNNVNVVNENISTTCRAQRKTCDCCSTGSASTLAVRAQEILEAVGRKFIHLAGRRRGSFGQGTNVRASRLCV